MNGTKIVIAGNGFVGKEAEVMLAKYKPDIYDPPKGMNDLADSYDFCFICVPTPQKADGSCDVRCVYDVFEKVNAKVFVCLSTIPPDVMLGEDVVFQPEYVASCSPYPAPLADVKARGFIILGGYPEAVKKVRRLYERIYPPTIKILEVTSEEARLIKYMANSFVAVYVSFCNEFFDICKAFGADYDKVREGFLLDPRMTPWWTYVYEHNRGWGGDCIPKDTSAIATASTRKGYSPELIKAVRKVNDAMRKGQQ